MCRYEKAKKYKSAVFTCSVLAAGLSLMPILTRHMTTIGYIITASIVISICFQAIANRKDR